MSEKKQMNKEKDGQINEQAGKQMNEQIDKHMGEQTDRQIDYTVRKESDNINTGQQVRSGKKIMAIFIGMMVLSLVIGYGVGLISKRLESSSGFADIMHDIGFFMQRATPVLFVAVNVVVLLVAFIIYRSTKKRIDDWDGEDETVIDEIESRLNVPMLCVSALVVVNFFFFSAMAEIIERTDFGQAHSDILSAVLLVTFILGFVCGTVIQKGIVDLTIKLNPEKRGNIFDRNFQKDWVDSCDEAQQLMIYKAAFAAYKAVNTACMVMWVLTLITGMILKTGLMPAFTVTVIWLVSIVTYSVYGDKLERGKIK